MKLFEQFKEEFSGLHLRKQRTTARERFIDEWTKIFRSEPEVFAGLYNGMYELSKGRMKKKASVLKEWNRRVEKNLGAEAKQSSAKYIVPMIEAPCCKKHALLAQMLLKAAGDAGVTHENRCELEMSEENCSEYKTSECKRCECGKVVKVLKPAWYNRGRLLENGFVKPVSQ